MSRQIAHYIPRGSLATLPLLRAGIFTGMVTLGTGTAFAQDVTRPAVLVAPAPVAPVAPAVSTAYKVAVGDTLEISVLGHPDLTKTITVLPEGIINFPYVGEVKVVGTTVSFLRTLITRRLSKELDSPQVGVSLMRRQEKMVSIIGAVKSAGKRVMGDNWRVLDLVADCGGISAERPEWTSATLVRGGGTQAIVIDMARLMATGDLKENCLLEAGDILLVQEVDVSRTQVKVVGAVVKQGMVSAPRDGSLITVLTEAGGPTIGASLSKAAIIRDGQTLPVDLSILGADGSVQAGTKIKAGDTLVIPENKRVFSIIGAVVRGGTQYYPETGTLTLTSALVAAGGTAPGADSRKANILRPHKDGTVEMLPVNLEAVLGKPGKNKNKPAEKDMVLEPGDVLFIPSKEGGGSNKMTLRDALSFVPFIGMFRR